MKLDSFKELAFTTAAAAFAALAPIRATLATVFTLVFIDWVAGVYRSVVVEKHAFSSQKWRDTAVKLVPYLLIILGGFCVDKVADLEALYFTRAFALLVMSIEIQSLGENTGFDLIAIIRAKLAPPPKE
jgi:hypothetical protein